MADKTDLHWAAWGERDPYFGVLSTDRFRHGTLADHRAEFFRSGEEFISDLLGRLQARWGASPAGGRALDFGCGVGRLTVALAQQFGDVTGVDVSPGMLKEAQRNCSERGLTNVTLTAPPSTPDTSSFDLVVSVMVLQHVRPSRGFGIIEGLLASVAPGGWAALHIPVADNRTPIPRLGSRIQRLLPFGRPIFNLLRGLPVSDPSVEMHVYDVARLLDIFRLAGGAEVLIVPGPPYPFQGATAIARRPPSP